MLLDQQYPELLIYATIAIGLIFAVTNPYHGFLFGVLGLTSINYITAVRTRTFLGPYFNLYDAFILILMLCYLLDIFSNKEQKRFTPPLVWAIIIVIIIGFVEGTALLGFRYEVLRSARWALNMPILILIAANFIINEKRTEQFLVTLFIGGIIAAIQHTLIAFDIANASEFSRYGYTLIRNVGFLFSPIAYFLVAAIVRPLLPHMNRLYHKLFWVVGVGLFAASVIFTQTRSLWIAVIIAPLLLALLVKESKVLRRTILIAVGSIVLILFILPAISAKADTFVKDTLFERITLITDDTQRVSSTRTRKAAFEVEGRDWLTGNWLTGNGFAYQYKYTFGYDTKIVAWGHLGYISYLVRLGIVGFLLYGIILPLSGTLRARKLYFYQPAGVIGGVALVAISCFVVDAITFIMSSSYIFSGTSTPALLFGATFGLYHLYIVPTAAPQQSNQRPPRANATLRRQTRSSYHTKLPL